MIEHHEVVELAHAAEAPPPDEQVPARFGAYESTCTGCGQADNHPVKVLVVQFGDPARGIEEVVERWHHDCHALATRDPHSVEVVEQAQGAKGHELRLLLHGDPANGVDPVIDPTSAATAMSPATTGPAAEADIENLEA